MPRKIFGLLSFYLVLSATFGYAGERLSRTVEISSVATGIVRSTGRNSLDIEDENTRTVKRFVYLDRSSAYHPGDRVRIDFDRGNGLVLSIRKMTVLPYSKGGQNLGYIIKN